MKKALKLFGFGIPTVFVAALAYIGLSSGLKSDPGIGLSPATHQIAELNVREFTSAPLRAEVKVYLPISVEDAMAIVAGFEDYPNWVDPAPKQVLVDNSATPDGQFGSGSKVSYSEGEFDIIEYHDKQAAMIARPLWGVEDFAEHRGVVLVTQHEGGSIMHMRRYFEPTSVKGWMMSKMMPIFMKRSAENLAQIHGGKVL
ncbi:MAG: hypothetical protein HRU27_21195 [Rhizobiaceae bacterium]|nr:hypothetical protein [Rhizobiaceae bacterium]